MTTDKIADIINQLKNAGAVRKESVVFVHSKYKLAFLEALQKSGFVADVTKKGKKVIKYIEVKVAYNADKTPKINGFDRISKNSKRVYIKASEARPVKSGYGVMIISTPKGILTDEQVRKENVGGEALCKIW